MEAIFKLKLGKFQSLTFRVHSGIMVTELKLRMHC